MQKNNSMEQDIIQRTMSDKKWKTKDVMDY